MSSLNIDVKHWEPVAITGNYKCPKCGSVMSFTPVMQGLASDVFAFCVKCQQYYHQKDDADKN